MHSGGRRAPLCVRPDPDRFRNRGQMGRKPPHLIDFETVGKWAESRRIAFTHFRSLVEQPQVKELIEQEVATGNASLAPVANIRRFHLLTKELDHDDGEVTATMKVRRSSIYQAYSTEIETLYA